MLDMEVPVTELDHASWAITGYLLGYLVGMPLIGRVSDVWGHRRLYVLSVVAFTVGSVAVALTQSLNWMIAARVFQAFGAGALVPISIAIVGRPLPSWKTSAAVGHRRRVRRGGRRNRPPMGRHDNPIPRLALGILDQYTARRADGRPHTAHAPPQPAIPRLHRRSRGSVGGSGVDVYDSRPLTHRLVRLAWRSLRGGRRTLPLTLHPAAAKRDRPSPARLPCFACSPS